jgi:hypothetical protein
MVRSWLVLMVLGAAPAASAQWVTRDARWQPRGPWNWAVPRELPALHREFNGIDFGHAHLAETLLATQDPGAIEGARLEVLEFIFSSPEVPPDEDAISPTFSRMAPEIRRTFNWAHTLHRSLYDLFASDAATDKDGVYRRLLEDYLSKPEAITPHPLDHHGTLWAFPESKSFRDRAPKFNAQIWAYHWLQAGVYDAQLMGGAARQRELMPRLIERYHAMLREPPVEWRFMPMMHEAAPEFSRRFPEAAAIFDNLHMLHDNVDDVLSRPDLYPTRAAQREALLRIHEIYLNRNHPAGQHRYAEYMAKHAASAAAGHGEHGGGGAMEGPRPPSAPEVLGAPVSPKAAGEGQHQQHAPGKPAGGRGGH